MNGRSRLSIVALSDRRTSGTDSQGPSALPLSEVRQLGHLREVPPTECTIGGLRPRTHTCTRTWIIEKSSTPPLGQMNFNLHGAACENIPAALRRPGPVIFSIRGRGEFAADESLCATLKLTAVPAIRDITGAR